MQRVNKEYRWYVVYTVTNHEKIVNDFLNRNGIESFLPQTKILKQWSDRKKWLEVPLFPSYVFVRVSCKEYYTVLSHPSSLKYVCFEGVAEPIKDHQIETLKQILNSDLQYKVIGKRFVAGQEVRINQEPLNNYMAEVIKYKGNNKILLRIDNIGFSLILDVPEEYVVAAEFVS